MTARESLPAMQTAPKMIVFTDWDGTVTLQDSNDTMTDNLGFGEARRKQLNVEVLEGRDSFRHAFSLMLESIDLPFDKCIDYLLERIEIDPGFVGFYEWCAANNVPVVVVSSGMKPVISALLKKLVGEKAANNIEIVANDVEVKSDGSWRIVYRDDSDFGHDKSLAIKPYAQLESSQRPVLFYCGDGVSDLSAARETDLLFAKRGRDLVIFCEREKIPHTLFDTFNDIHKVVQDVYEGKSSVDQVAQH